MNLENINLASISVRLLLAALLGAAIGFDREQRNKAAGLRTHMLICIGAAMTMITNQFIFENIFSETDPARMGAQVISGIGFLGIGTIIVTSRQKVTGLTTAAGLWASASVGLAIGIGFYSGAIIGGIMILIIIILFQKIEDYMKNKTKTFWVYFEIDSLTHLNEFEKYLIEQNIQIKDIEINRTVNNVTVEILVQLPEFQLHADFARTVMDFEGVNLARLL